MNPFAIWLSDTFGMMVDDLYLAPNGDFDLTLLNEDDEVHLQGIVRFNDDGEVKAFTVIP